VDLNKQFQGCVVWLLENAVMGKLSVQKHARMLLEVSSGGL